MIRFSAPYLLFAALPALGWVVLVLLHRKSRPVLRVTALLLLLIALAGPRISQQQEDHNAVFLIDRSASVTRTSTDATAREAIDRITSRHPEWSFAAVEFADTAALTVPLNASAFPIGMAPFAGTASNLDAAVRLGLSILPDQGSNQLILISDGLFTDDVDTALSTSQLANVPISTVGVGLRPQADVALLSIHGPASVPVARPFSLQIEVASAQAVDATLVVYRDNELLSFAEVSLQAGLNRFSFDDSFSEPMAHAYQAIVKSADDPIPDNDTLSILVEASDHPSILVVDPQGESAVPALVHTLGLAHTSSDAIPPLEVLSDYRQVVLTGLSMTTLTVHDLDVIDSFVRDLGGGLLVVQGEEEVRGVAEGGIEELLPVSYTVPEKSREAQLALVYVLDRSSSMRSRVAGAEKIEILKEAAAASAALLDATTYVGILGFNLGHEWLVPIAPVDSTTIYHALREIEAIGGTDLYYPIVETLDRLEEIDVPAKHILIISDGKTVEAPRDYAGLVRRLQQSDNVTLSAIGVGRTMNVSLLSALVEAGSGTLYRADDFSMLPQISIQATQRISRHRFVDGPVEVVGRLLESINASPPPLDGYVLTYPKPGADTSLWAGEDPIVSSWHVGLGTVTVLNTDLSGHGSEMWLAWPGLSGLLDAVLSTTEPYRSPTFGLSATTVLHANAIELLVDARADEGGFANFLDLEVQLLPDSTTFDLHQKGPGLYARTLPTLPQGGYALHVIDRTRERTLTLPLTIPYPSEYKSFGADQDTLQHIAEATGGVMLGADSTLPRIPPATTTTYKPLHPTLLLAALGTFLLDLLCRKWPSNPLRQRSPRRDD